MSLPSTVTPDDPSGEPTPISVLSPPMPPAARLIMAGIVAGLVAWIGGEAARGAFRPRWQAVNVKGIILKDTSPRDRELAEMLNAGLAFAMLGAALGAGLGFAGGLGRGSSRAALGSAGLGAAGGALACALMSAIAVPLHMAYRRRYPDEAMRDMIFPLLVHASIWSVAGAAAGIAVAWGARRRDLLPRAAVGGLLGAAIGAAVYELVGVVAFPDAGTTRYLSTTAATRLLARLIVSLLAAVGIVAAIAPPREGSVSAPASGPA